MEALAEEIRQGRYDIAVSPQAAFQVKTAALLKRALKEIHALGGDYVSVLLGRSSVFSASCPAEKKSAPQETPSTAL